MSTIVEELRKEAVSRLLSINTIAGCFPTWKPEINHLTPAKTSEQILSLGDHLSEIFHLSTTTRDQGGVSKSGTAWESLVCWYLNLCSIGRRTVIIKYARDLIPEVVKDAIVVNYHNFSSDSETDLIAITFPDNDEYCCNKDDISISDASGTPIPVRNLAGEYNLREIIDALCARDFRELELHIIQCKTNWKDNAQIPMLWDAIYAAKYFSNGISVGRNNYSVSDVSRFTYSFVTVPTNTNDVFTSEKIPVKRVTNLSGGNYWGKPTLNDVASSVREMLNRNLRTGHTDGHRSTLDAELPNLETTYSYFGLY